MSRTIFEQGFKDMLKEALMDGLEICIEDDSTGVEVSIRFEGELIDSDSFPK